MSSQSGQPITNTEQLSLTPASLYNNSNPLYKSNEQKPSFTLQSLNDMTPEALISKYDGWDLKELINEDISEDGILEKNYPLSELRSPANSRPKLLPKNLSARNFTYKEKFAKNTRNLTEEILKRANELSKLDKMSEKRRFDNLGGLSDDKNKKYLNRNI